MSRSVQSLIPWLTRHPRNDESGFSLLELVSVVAMMGVFGIAIATSLQSFTTTTTSTQNKNFALADVRSAVESISRDLRAANPIDAIPLTDPVSRYDNRISFTVYCSTVGDNGCSSSHARRVVYEVVGNKLIQTVGLRSRALLQPRTGLNAVPQSERPGAVVNAATQPPFTYKTRSGQVLDTSSSSGTAPTTFRNCTKTVTIHLTVIADPRRPDTAINLITSVDLRNSNEVSNCP